MPEDTFITYTHPDEIIAASNRRRVAQYVATHLRNRSAPLSRRGYAPRGQQPRRLAPADNEHHHIQTSPLLEVKRSTFFESIPRDHHGLRQDPFTVLPTQHNDTLTKAVDYCKERLHMAYLYS